MSTLTNFWQLLQLRLWGSTHTSRLSPFSSQYTLHTQTSMHNNTHSKDNTHVHNYNTYLRERNDFAFQEGKKIDLFFLPVEKYNYAVLRPCLVCVRWIQTSPFHFHVSPWPSKYNLCCQIHSKPVINIKQMKSSLESELRGK